VAVLSPGERWRSVTSSSSSHSGVPWAPGLPSRNRDETEAQRPSAAARRVRHGRRVRFDEELPVRYRDLDTLGNVDDAVYATYLEQARIRYVDHLLGPVVTDDGIMLANLEIDFQRPVPLDAGSVRVECGVLEVGESSFRMGYRVYGDGDSPAATGESVQVAWDGDSSRPLPAEWREAVRAFEPGIE